MRRIIVLATLAAAACDTNRGPAPSNAEGLCEIHTWDARTEAKGHYAYDAMFVSPPSEAVPVLIAKLGDRTPTAIDDLLHDKPSVGHVAFHILLRIYGLRASAFEHDGVWIMESDPSKNPIYQVKFRDDATREKLARRFHELGVKRGWLKN